MTPPRAKVQDKLADFFQQYPMVGFPKGEVVISAYTDSPFFYRIETGAVKMSFTSPEGKSLSLHIFFPASFFSLLSIVNHEKNNYDFITVLPTTVRKVPQAEFLAFLRSNSDVLFDLQLRLLKGMQGLLDRIEEISLGSASSQVMSLLHYFAKHFADETHQDVFSVKITHQEIADWLGLSRENVSIQMKLLEKLGLIKMREKHIQIVEK